MPRDSLYLTPTTFLSQSQLGPTMVPLDLTQGKVYKALRSGRGDENGLLEELSPTEQLGQWQRILMRRVPPGTPNDPSPIATQVTFDLSYDWLILLAIGQEHLTDNITIVKVPVLERRLNVIGIDGDKILLKRINQRPSGETVVPIIRIRNSRIGYHTGIDRFVGQYSDSPAPATFLIARRKLS